MSARTVRGRRSFAPGTAQDPGTAQADPGARQADPGARRPDPVPWYFDPVELAAHESNAWVGYYRRDWRLVLRSATGMVRLGFGLPWPAALRGAWWVLRANQAWAPYPDNDPDAARAHLRRFYRLVGRARRLPIDPAEAARREVTWWHEHRLLQRDRTDADETDLVEALALLYAYVYDRPAGLLYEAARDRALAMRISDAWVADGCDPADDRLRQERLLLVRSYARLLDVVGPDAPVPGPQDHDHPSPRPPDDRDDPAR